MSREPGTRVVAEIDHIHMIGVQAFIVRELRWNDTERRSFDVYFASDGDCLTDAESFDEYPSDDEILDALRAFNYAALRSYVAGEGECLTYDNVDPQTHRYAAAANEWTHGRKGTPHGGGLVYLAQTLEEAFAILADAVLEGFAPDGVYDLATGDKTEVHVSTPVVTASEDQGATLNPLRDRLT